MNTFHLLLIAAAVLLAGYLLYGRFLAKRWRIGSRQSTPAHFKQDNWDYVPSRRGDIFCHQFAANADRGLLVGTVQASIFGWVPMLLWLLLGSVFLGGVQDMAALFTSVRNQGRSLGRVLERNFGKWYKRMFLAFAWICAVLAVAAFTDWVAQNYFGLSANGGRALTAGRITALMIYITVMSFFLGLIVRHGNLSHVINELIAVLLVVAAVMLGYMYPIYLRITNWHMILFVYVTLSASLPVWMLLQPRDKMNTSLIVFIMFAAVLGIIIARPAMQLEPFRGFAVDGKLLFPYLFVTATSGAVSGYHAMVASSVTSKMIRNEGRIRMVSFGTMMLSTFLGVIFLLVVGSRVAGANLENINPILVFSTGVADNLHALGISREEIMELTSFVVCSLVITSLDSVTRVGRTVWQEMLLDAGSKEEERSKRLKVFSSRYFATAITVLPAVGIAQLGYKRIWPLFGGVNLFLSAAALLACLVFFKKAKRKRFVLWIAALVMVAFSAAASASTVMQVMTNVMTGASASVLIDILYFLFAAAELGLLAILFSRAMISLLKKS